MWLWILMQVCLAAWRCSAAPSIGFLQTPFKPIQNEWASYYDQGENSYAFGYDVEDAKTGNVQYRQEERYPNGTVVGSYGVVEADGNVKIVHYVADEAGYRVKIENSLRKLAGYHPPLALLKALNPLQVFYPRKVNNPLPSTPSPQLTSALGSQQFPSGLFEQHIRPSSNQNIPQQNLELATSFLENNSLKPASDQSQNYPAFLPPPLGFVA